MKKEKEFQKHRKNLSEEDQFSIALDHHGSCCDVDHKNDPTGENHRTINVVCIPFQGSYISLSVCEECQNELNREQGLWNLCVCTQCGTVKWVPRKVMESKIVLLPKCPRCKSEN